MDLDSPTRFFFKLILSHTVMLTRTDLCSFNIRDLLHRMEVEKEIFLGGVVSAWYSYVG